MAARCLLLAAVLGCFLLKPADARGLWVRGGSNASKSETKRTLNEHIKEQEQQAGRRERLRAQLSELRSKAGVSGDALDEAAERQQSALASVVDLVPTVLPMLLMWKLDMKEPATLFRVRLVFGAYLMAANVVFYVLRKRIRAANDETELVIPPPPFIAQMVDGYLEGNRDKAGGGGGMPPAEAVKGIINNYLSRKTTVMDYDLKELSRMAKAIGWPVLVTALMHFRFKMAHPLVFSLVQGSYALVASPLARIYFYGHEARGACRRPFVKPESMIQKYVKQQQQQLQQQQQEAQEGKDGQAGEEAAVLEVAPSGDGGASKGGKDDADLDWTNFEEAGEADSDVINVDEDYGDFPEDLAEGEE